MSKINVARPHYLPGGYTGPGPHTHEGAPSPYIAPLAQLRRAVQACLLWEDSFYESGVAIEARIEALAKEVPFADLAALAVESRTRLNLRHAPLALAVAAIKARKEHGRAVGDLINAVIQRADEPAEFLSLYWKSQPNAPLTKQMKVGLGRAIRKFDAYQLAKYKGQADKKVRLRDVLFLVHAKPAPRDVDKYKALADDTLVAADTWENALSAGADKRETFARLMSERRLGTLAFLRNLRNMLAAGIEPARLEQYTEGMNVDRILPFRFITAATHNPQLEPMLERLMLRACQSQPKLYGHTAIVVDNSASMTSPISSKSEVSRIDAASALAILARETCQEARCFVFSNECVEVPPRRGFALRDVIRAAMVPQWTLLGKAVKHVYSVYPACDRIIVITDEQSADRPEHPRGKGYIVNVASYQNGIAYGPWQSITGFSESILGYIRESEAS
jgi:hypothetical protein